MTARDRILNRIRTSLDQVRLPADPPVRLPPAPAAYPPASALLDQFQAELTAVSGQCERVPPADLPARVVTWARAHGVNQLLTWPEIPPAVLAALTGAGIAPVTPAPNANLADIEPLFCGLTTADAALADTGTLVMLSRAGRSRLAYMAVRAHLALVYPEQFHPSLAAWLAHQPHLADDLRHTSAAVLITGPSRTADIEMTLTVGVHGPGELVVFIVSP